MWLPGCGGGGDSTTNSNLSNNNSGTTILKLASGNTWSYDVTNSNLPYIGSNNGTKTRVMSAPSNVITLTDTEQLAIGPQTVAVYTFTVANNGDVSMSDGTNSGMYLPASHGVNATWTFMGGTATVSAINVSKTVPAGTFTDCIQVDTTDATGTGSWYFSPTAGNYVYTIHTTTSGTHEEALTSYTAN